MSQLYGYTQSNEFSSSGSANNGTGSFSVSSGLNAAFNLNSGAYESYRTSSSISGLVTSLGESTANASDSFTVNQIANDLLQLNRTSSGILRNSVETSVVGASGFVSSVETAILKSSAPIELEETEEITVMGQRGIWANKSEVINWKGEIPVQEYLLNEDPNPDVITKKTSHKLEYIQELAIRYLRPPTPPSPGEIIIQQEANKVTPPAPPLVIRQQPPRPVTPQPLVVREAPPQPPVLVGKKIITISGKRLPPPPRKVVIERLAPLPSKPQSVIIERWLPYNQVKRQVIFQKSAERDPILVKPKNVIIQWEAPQVVVKKEFKDLGVIRANPAEYVARYGNTLKVARDLPPFVLEIKPPAGVVLAADYQYNSVYELEGDLQALRLVDLDREGLSEYRSLVQRLALNSGNLTTDYTISNASASITGSSFNSSDISSVIAEIFGSIDRDNNGKISLEEGERILLRLNSRLGRRYGEDDAKAFFSRLDTNRDGHLDLAEFKKAFERSL